MNNEGFSFVFVLCLLFLSSALTQQQIEFGLVLTPTIFQSKVLR